jgi:hypothetical protein
MAAFAPLREPETASVPVAEEYSSNGRSADEPSAISEAVSIPRTAATEPLSEAYESVSRAYEWNTAAFAPEVGETAPELACQPNGQLETAEPVDIADADVDAPKGVKRTRRRVGKVAEADAAAETEGHHRVSSDEVQPAVEHSGEVEVELVSPGGRVIEGSAD